MEGKYEITSANGINKFPRSNLREHIHFPLKVTKTKGNFLSPSPFRIALSSSYVSGRKVKRIKKRREEIKFSNIGYLYHYTGYRVFFFQTENLYQFIYRP